MACHLLFTVAPRDESPSRAFLRVRLGIRGEMGHLLPGRNPRHIADERVGAAVHVGVLGVAILPIREARQGLQANGLLDTGAA